MLHCTGHNIYPKKKKKKESKIKEKITNFNELREESFGFRLGPIVISRPALYKTVLYTAQPVSRCSIGAKEVDEVQPLVPSF